MELLRNMFNPENFNKLYRLRDPELDHIINGYNRQQQNIQRLGIVGALPLLALSGYKKSSNWALAAFVLFCGSKYYSV